MIGIVALIIFGPRKLPQIAKTIGKTMADFRKTTSEFKTTWEKEVNFEGTEIKNIPVTNDLKPIENTIEIENKPIAEENSILSPEIKEISSSEMEKILALKEKNEAEPQPELKENDKRSWL